jgi:hypothetical protein
MFLKRKISLHAGDEGHSWLFGRLSCRNHRCGECNGAFSCRIVGAGAGFDVKHKRVGILRDLLAHDAAALQGYGAHGTGNVAQSVDFFVCLQKYREFEELST